MTQLRALRALVNELRIQKRAATKRATVAKSAEKIAAPERESSVGNTAPESPERESPSRYVPAPTRRAVFDRDSARCAYRDDRGERCRETFALEIHHRHPYALGGSTTLDNLELRCRAHDTLAAEKDFGREHMARMRGVSGDAAPERDLVRAL